jgi:hypothetical protein
MTFNDLIFGIVYKTFKIEIVVLTTISWRVLKRQHSILLLKWQKIQVDKYDVL